MNFVKNVQSYFIDNENQKVISLIMKIKNLCEKLFISKNDR